jgi:hypothetical protein
MMTTPTATDRMALTVPTADSSKSDGATTWLSLSRIVYTTAMIRATVMFFTFKIGLLHVRLLSRGAGVEVPDPSPQDTWFHFPHRLKLEFEEVLQLPLETTLEVYRGEEARRSVYGRSRPGGHDSDIEYRPSPEAEVAHHADPKDDKREARADEGQLGPAPREKRAVAGEPRPPPGELRAVVGQIRPLLGEPRARLRQSSAVLRETRSLLGEACARPGEARAIVGQARPFLGQGRALLRQLGPEIGHSRPMLGQIGAPPAEGGLFLDELRPLFGEMGPSLGVGRPLLGQRVSTLRKADEIRRQPILLLGQSDKRVHYSG